MEKNIREKSKDNIIMGGRKFYYIIAIGGQITFLLVGPVVFCLLVGLWLDGFFHTTPLFIIIGVIIGFIGSILNVFRVMKIIDKF